MFKMLKGAVCYTPEYSGRQDILLFMDKIAMVEENISYASLPNVEVYDCKGRIACPGFIDQHVHILGGGGEKGPGSRIPEIAPEDIFSAGVCTAVGILGLDSIGRTVEGLLSKARSLETFGLHTYIYTGYYGLPAVTLTGRVLNDIACIDKVIGAGEIAISDYRSAHPDVKELKRLAFEVMTGGMVGGKAGVLHLHVGDGKKGLEPLLELLDDSDFPLEMFVPTHLNRNRTLFEQALAYAARGGNTDLTAGEKTGKGLSVADSLKRFNEVGMAMDKVTVSSDGNGSMPEEGGAAGSVRMLFDDIRECVVERNMPVESVIRLVTSNVASLLKLYPSKGALKPGSSADILVLDSSGFSIDKLFAGGRLVMDQGTPVASGGR